jgi:hypothetical protein
MKLHHLQTAFLVICWVLVCSQGRSQNNNDGGGIFNTGTLTMNGGSVSNNTATNYGGGIYNTYNTGLTFGSTTNNNTINNDIITNTDIIINNNDNFGDGCPDESNIIITTNNDNFGDGCPDESNIITNNTITNNTNINNTITNNTNINNTDPAVPEPTTLSLLAMSLLFAGRRWR